MSGRGRIILAAIAPLAPVCCYIAAGATIIGGRLRGFRAGFPYFIGKLFTIQSQGGYELEYVYGKGRNRTAQVVRC